MKILLTRPLALILFLFVVGLSPGARADTQYSYTGDDFTSWTNTACLPACRITGSLILETPLLTGLNFADVTPLSYSFTDGITTWTDINAPGGIFEFSTDATGNISFWVASLAKTQDPSQCDPGSADLRFLQFESTSTFAFNSATAICSTDTAVIRELYEAENQSSGTWSVSTGGTPIPEPGTVLLLGAGLTALLGLRRRNLWTVAAKISALGLALFWLAMPAGAQENIWLGQPEVPGSWSDLAQWNLGSVPASSIPDGSINIDIPQGTALGDVSFTNSHTLTIEKAGQYNILSLTTVINAHDTGLIDNSGGLVNGGSLTNELSASIINDFGELVNNGVISNELSASLENVPHGILINNGVISNQLLGIMDNAGFLDNMSGGLITNDLNSTIDNSAIWKNESGATLSNFGAMKNSGLLQNLGFLNNVGSFANFNLLQIGSGGILNNSGSISNVSGGGFVVQGGGTFNNSGSFLSDYLSSFGNQAGSKILNTGDMSLGGNISIGGSLRNNGTITMVAGPATGDPAIQPPAPPLLITSTGKLSGTGTVNQGLFGFGVINQGVMAPGDPLGAFTIVGNYQQTTTGTLEIFLGGTGAGRFGQLDITGGADLGGALDVELFAGFDPQAGEMFEILESGGITNLDFLSMLFPTLPDGLFFKLDKEGNNLFLDVMQGSGDGGGGNSVPEPSSLLLLATALLPLGGYLRWKNPDQGQGDRAALVIQVKF
jgi:hypothetical protein